MLISFFRASNEAGYTLLVQCQTPLALWWRSKALAPQLGLSHFRFARSSVSRAKGNAILAFEVTDFDSDLRGFTSAV